MARIKAVLVLPILVLGLTVTGTQAIILQIDPNYPSYYISDWNSRVRRQETTAYCAGYQMTDALTQTQLDQVLALCREGKMKNENQYTHNVYWLIPPGEVVSEVDRFTVLEADSYYATPVCVQKRYWTSFNAWSRVLCYRISPNGSSSEDVPTSGGGPSNGNETQPGTGEGSSSDGSVFQIPLATLFFNVFFLVFALISATNHFHASCFIPCHTPTEQRL